VRAKDSKVSAGALPLVPTRCITAIKLRATLVPKLPLGNPVSKAPALRAGKLELPVLNSQAGAWELARRTGSFFLNLMAVTRCMGTERDGGCTPVTTVFDNDCRIFIRQTFRSGLQTPSGHSFVIWIPKLELGNQYKHAR